MDAIVVNNAIYNLSTALREQDNARLRKGRKLTLVTVQADDLYTVLGSLIAMRNAAPRQQPAPAVDDALADTQRAIIEAAERRGYERAKAEAVVVGDALVDAAIAAPDAPFQPNAKLKKALARAQGVQS